MLGLKQVHHIAIIATDYAASKAFYCDVLGFTLMSEAYREERDSWKGDLALNGQYVIELFFFPVSTLPSEPTGSLRFASSGVQCGGCGKVDRASGSTPREV